MKLTNFKSKLLKKINSGLSRKIIDWIEVKSNKVKNTGVECSSGWSFVIITDGKSMDILLKSVQSIVSQFREYNEYEIIVIGPKIDHLEISKDINLRYSIYKEMGILPGYITRKKNIGVQLAKFDKVVVCHDYIFFEECWLDGFIKTGNDFDVCITKVKLLDGRRTRDWMTWDYPGVGPALLPYNQECTQYQYINGAYFIVKRNFYLQNPLDESLRWGEAEDVEWSKRVRQKTKFVINTVSSVRYLRQKPINDAPYCDSWIENTKKLEKILIK